ncbi:MAG: pilus assembly protein PilP [Deltaproteobacteria bacterium]|nr:pilus assembly protein PilP [Deltaproteobacteria bacterium]
MIYRKTKLFAFLAVLSMLIGGGCDDSKPKKPPLGKHAANKKKSQPRASRRGASASGKHAKPKKVRVVELGDQDFVESPSNRDPFRSYMSEFNSATERRQLVVTRRILLRRYGLDELTLVAVVTGGVRAQAMFRDPTGLGVTVKRGDYISKSDGRIKEILPGRVVVEIKENYEGGQKMADRVIELHQKVTPRR